MNKRFWFFSTLLVFALLVTACSAAATTVAPTQPAVVATATTAADLPDTGTQGAVINVSQTDQFGSFLVDSKGMSLYLFTNDTPNVTNCYDQCATNWPPLLTTGAPVAGEGVDQTLLGITERTEGTMQVTYNGWPLYYYIKDKAAGDVTGQLVGDVWFLITPAGEMITTAPSTGSDPSSAGTTVALSKNDQLGSFLVDAEGMTLYLFTKDTPNVTNCYEQCAEAWPPLLTTGDPIAGEGVDAALLGTTERTEGTIQVTYNGWPLYYYFKDAKAGDVTGQLVGDVWFVLSPAGEMITTSADASSASEGAEVKVAQNDTLGSFLVDDEGMTLYIFTKDTPNTSNCYDQCATNWPPLLTVGEPRASDGVDDSMIGTTERTDGTLQVTYNGWPLYYYIDDKAAGDTTGQAVGDVWYVLSPAGEAIGAN
jgi:predicted lipoprotein with Yx(FWY)xxD motif